MIEIAQVLLHKAHEPNAVPDLGDADILTREGVTEIHFSPLETDSAAAGHNLQTKAQPAKCRQEFVARKDIRSQGSCIHNHRKTHRAGGKLAAAVRASRTFAGSSPWPFRPEEPQRNIPIQSVRHC
jgi:hypothetical protein